MSRHPDASQNISLLDPAVLSAVGQLEMVSLRIVEGFLAGMHRSRLKGGCVEFAEHRAYTPGDEIRLLDWRVYARSDRHYIKQFEEDTNLQATLVVDASGSMRFGLSTASKFRHAQVAAACLARLMLHQRDSVGLAMAGAHLRAYVPPRSRPDHLAVLLQTLAATGAGEGTALAGVLRDLARRLRRRGLVIVLSDALDDVEAMLEALRGLHTRGHETALLHIMAPEELTFSFRRWSRFQCLEVAGRRLDLDPATVRGRYLQRVQAFLERLRDGCGQIGCDYAPMPTDRPLGEALAWFLGRRMARGK